MTASHLDDKQLIYFNFSKNIHFELDFFFFFLSMIYRMVFRIRKLSVHMYELLARV